MKNKQNKLALVYSALKAGSSVARADMRFASLRRLSRYTAAAMLLMMSTACVPRSEVRPQMETIVDAAACAAPSRILVVFLPGIYDTPKDLVREGFVAALRRQSIAADVVLADANLGYYKAGIITDRLHSDVIAPALARGYEQIWLVGISLGGYGAFSYARENRADISGVLAIAPYLGKQELIDAIADSGGLASWPANVPATAPSDAQDGQDRRVWRWLQSHTRTNPGNPKIYMGFGTEDKFAGNNAMLAQALPASQVLTTPGGHDWAPWLRVWESFLTRQTWPACQQAPR